MKNRITNKIYACDMYHYYAYLQNVPSLLDLKYKNEMYELV